MNNLAELIAIVLLTICVVMAGAGAAYFFWGFVSAKDEGSAAQDEERLKDCEQRLRSLELKSRSKRLSSMEALEYSHLIQKRNQLRSLV